MKQESPTTTLDDVIKQKPFVDASKVIVKDKSNVNNSAIKVEVDEKVIDEIVNNNNNNNNKNNNNEINNDNNDNSQYPKPIDKHILDVQPMELTTENDVKPIVTNVTNGNNQTFIDDNNNNNNSKSKINIDNNNNNNNNDDDNNNNNHNNNNSDNNNKELDDTAKKELLSKISATLAEYYGGGGNNYDEIEEPQKKRPRSGTKVSSIVLTKEGEDTASNAFPEVKIRDFAFLTDDPRHWGQVVISQEEEEDDDEDDEDDDSKYVNRRARALYDFQAENSNELSFQEGDNLFIECRQYVGWLMANLGEESGLIPENYVKLLDDDEEDEDEYGNWAEEGNDG